MEGKAFVRPGCDAFAITATPQNGMLDLRDRMHLSLLQPQPGSAGQCQGMFYEQSYAELSVFGMREGVSEKVNPNSLKSPECDAQEYAVRVGLKSGGFLPACRTLRYSDADPGGGVHPRWRKDQERW